MSSLQGVTGSVTREGMITSNGNFTCQHDDKGPYEIGYSSGLTNPVPLVSLTANNPEKTYTLQASADGFSLQVWKRVDGELQEATAAFDFIVAQIV